MPKVFNESKHQSTFDQDGFVLVDNFYSDDDLNELNNLLRNFEQYTEAYLDGAGDTINNMENGKFFTRHFRDLKTEEQIRFDLSLISNRAIQRFLSVEYKCVAGLGIFKRANSPNSHVKLHVHHSNLAPDNPLPGLSMFAPLHDLSEKLGPLGFIKGSHKLWQDDLSYTLTDMQECYPDIYPLMQSFLTTVTPLAGQAIVFDQFTIHAGEPNTHPTQDRMAMTAEFIPANEDCVLFLPAWNDKGKIAALKGRHVTKLPLEFSNKHRWVPEHLGEEIMSIDNYQPLEITKEKFLQSCRK